MNITELRLLDEALSPTQLAALKQLRAAGIFFYDDPSELDEEEMEDPKWLRGINLNDAMWWACSDVEFVPDDALEEVATLLHRYGWCGVLYWCSRRSDRPDPEFEHVKRMIAFVEREEAIRATCKKSSEYAYKKADYIKMDEYVQAS